MGTHRSALKSSRSSCGRCIIAFLSFLLCIGFAERKANAQTFEDDVEAPRKFNDVLGDLLNEFSYDLKTNQVSGLQNISVRRVAVSENIPKSYESYLESLVLERVRKHSKIKVIQCTACRVKRSVVENNRLTITIPINNQAELDKLADQLGVDAWLDIALLYQESSMILAFNAFDSKTKELIWTKVYSSESINRKSKNVDANGKVEEVDEDSPKKRKSNFVGALTLGYHLVPNVKKASSMLGVNLRAGERFNLGRSEIGAMLVAIVDPQLFVSDYSNVDGDPSESEEVVAGDGSTETITINPFQFAGGFFATYHHNFFTLPENIDSVRFGSHLGIGALYSTGFLAFGGRLGMNMKFGHWFLTEAGVAYYAPTKIRVNKTFEYTTKGGIGGDITFGLSF